VDQPLVVPGGLHRGVGRAGELVEDVGCAGGDRAGLGGVVAVGVGGGQRLLGAVAGEVAEQDQAGDQGALVGEVAVGPSPRSRPLRMKRGVGSWRAVAVVGWPFWAASHAG
jgi:hypothetical protein